MVSRLMLMFVCVALLTVSGVVWAQEAPPPSQAQAPASWAQEAPKWSFAEAGFIDFNPDGGASDDGWYARGSMKLFNNFHLMAEYDDVGDFTFWNFGAGWHGLLGDPGDLYADVLWNDVEADSPTGSDSYDSYVISGGVRWKFGKWFEAKSGLNWIDKDRGGNDTTLEAEGSVWLMNSRLGFGLNFESGDDDTMRFFARFNFGK